MKSRIWLDGGEEKSISDKGVKSQNDKYSRTGTLYVSQNIGSQ